MSFDAIVSVAKGAQSGLMGISREGAQWILQDPGGFTNGPGMLLARGAPGRVVAVTIQASRTLDDQGRDTFALHDLDYAGGIGASGAVRIKRADPLLSPIITSMSLLRGNVVVGSAASSTSYNPGTGTPQPGTTWAWDAFLDGREPHDRLVPGKYFVPVGHFQLHGVGQVHFPAGRNPYAAGQPDTGFTANLEPKGFVPFALRLPESFSPTACAFDGRLLWVCGIQALVVLDTAQGTGPDSWPIVYQEDGRGFADVQVYPDHSGAVALSVTASWGDCKLHRYDLSGATAIVAAVPLNYPLQGGRQQVFNLDIGSDDRIALPYGIGNQFALLKPDLSIDYTVPLDGLEAQVTGHCLGMARASRMVVSLT